MKKQKRKKREKSQKNLKIKKSQKDQKVQNKRNIFDYLGLPSDVVISDPKIIMTDDYLLQFFNHRGIIDITDTEIKINAKKCIYKIKGTGLFIAGMTDDEIEISGKIISVERE